MSRRPTPYRERITAFCQANGIEIPRNFDAPQSSERFVIVDQSCTPPRLMSRSTFFEKTLLSWVEEARRLGKEIRILDIKRQCELQYGEDGKLRRGAAIDALSDRERAERTWLKATDA